jgi:hypothetical protein
VINLFRLWWRQEKPGLACMLIVLALNGVIPSLLGDGHYEWFALILVLDVLLAISVVQDYRRANGTP